MNTEKLERGKLYLATMAVLKSWLQAGMISEEEYRLAEEKMREKYRIRISNLFTDIDLL